MSRRTLSEGLEARLGVVAGRGREVIVWRSRAAVGGGAVAGGLWRLAWVAVLAALLVLPQVVVAGSFDVVIENPDYVLTSRTGGEPGAVELALEG